MSFEGIFSPNSSLPWDATTFGSSAGDPTSVLLGGATPSDAAIAAAAAAAAAASTTTSLAAPTPNSNGSGSNVSLARLPQLNYHSIPYAHQQQQHHHHHHHQQQQPLISLMPSASQQPPQPQPATLQAPSSSRDDMFQLASQPPSAQPPSQPSQSQPSQQQQPLPSGAQLSSQPKVFPPPPLDAQQQHHHHQQQQQQHHQQQQQQLQHQLMLQHQQQQQQQQLMRQHLAQQQQQQPYEHFMPSYLPPVATVPLPTCISCSVMHGLLGDATKQVQQLHEQLSKATIELASTSARLEERVADVSELKAAKTLLDNRVSDQQQQLLALQTQLIELRADERRLRARNEELEARNRTLLTDVRAELSTLATASEVIGKRVDSGLAHDRMLSAALADAEQHQHDEVMDLHDIDRILRDALPIKRASSSSSSSAAATAAATLANTHTNTVSTRRKRTAEDAENDATASTAAPTAGATADDDDGDADPVRRAKEARVEVTPVVRDRSRAQTVSIERNIEARRSAIAETPRSAERGRPRVTFVDEERRNPRERAKSVGPASSRRELPGAAAADAATPGAAANRPAGLRAEWQELREWAAKMSTPEVRAKEKQRLAEWKVQQGLVPPKPAQASPLVVPKPVVRIPVIAVSDELKAQLAARDVAVKLYRQRQAAAAAAAGASKPRQ